MHKGGSVDQDNNWKSSSSIVTAWKRMALHKKSNWLEAHSGYTTESIPIEDVGAPKNYALVIKLLGNIVPSDGIKGGTILSIQENAYCSRNDN